MSISSVIVHALLVVAQASSTPAGPPPVRVQVRDATGTARPALCSVRGAGITTQTRTDFQGICVLQLPRGTYLLYVVSAGFAPATRKLVTSDVRSRPITVTLTLPKARTTVDVSDSDPLLSTAGGNSTAIANRVRKRQMNPQMSRGVVDLVRTTPGWVLEANGVLHPRGAEYNTQYVVDGVPVYNNRSPAFAPALDIVNLQSASVETGGFPASIGRKLGGVVELHSADPPMGWHGAITGDGGGFDSRQVGVQLGWARNRTSLSAGGSYGASDRFMDPPAIENFSNFGQTDALNGSLSHQWDERRSLRFTFDGGSSTFQVPNELEQQRAGQRQSRSLDEWRVASSYDQILSDSVVLQLRASSVHDSAELSSNALATPIVPYQFRRDGQFYGASEVLVHRSHHDLAGGADVLVTTLGENFSYHISDPTQFDPGLQRSFAFHQANSGVETAAFVQDRVSFGPLVANVGVRWDDYNFLVREEAISPRVALAYNLKRAGLVLRGSYDHLFSTPAIENLLLASSPVVRSVSPGALGLPVHPEEGNSYEVGLSKRLGNIAGLDVRAYRRDLVNYADDDVFLNTGVSFPISFADAQIEGIEASLRIPLWRRISAAVSYSNLSGVARQTVTGGLFLSGGADLLRSSDVIRITQDQRTTMTAQFWYQLTRRLWIGSSGWYGSGLPTELEPGDTATTDIRILQMIDLLRNRVRPSYELDLLGGARLWGEGTRAVDAEAAVSNVTDHLNVIDFAGLFSGTALAPPRTFSLRLKYRF